MNSVLDSSAILAAVLQERGGDCVLGAMDAFSVSSVNLAEVVSKLYEKGYEREDVERSIDGFLPYVVPFDTSMAILSGELQRSLHGTGLSLGDRACIALAINTRAEAVTADRVWAELDVECEVRLIR